MITGAQFREELGQHLVQVREGVTRAAQRLHDRWEKISLRPWQKWALVFSAVVVFTVCLAIGLAWRTYAKYSDVVHSRLTDGILQPAAQIYSAPEVIEPGKRISMEEMIALLRKCDYTEYATNETGYFQVVKKSLRVYPGPRSYVKNEPVVFDFNKSGIRRISTLRGKKLLESYLLEPLLVTSMYDRERAKRRLVKYDEIPVNLRNAILAIEDHRFFEHHGIDLVRTAKAAYDGLASWERPRATSTLTQQLARGFFLTPERTYRRKIAELMIAVEMEDRLSKQKIFEYYCNHVPLGSYGSFNISGMGEAADTFFRKNLSQITLPEAALLAGLIQRPSWFNPYRYPERAKERRNIVLGAMRRENFITEEERAAAARTPVKVQPYSVDTAEAPYFVDLADRELRRKFSEQDLLTRGMKVYTTLDPDLQHIAVAAVARGMERVDALVKQQSRWKGKEVPKPQVALVAIDPKTGAVKALLGGRSYERSQLNRVLAERQPGSVFKPFVYAAALDPERGHMTPASTVQDEDTTFLFGDEVYEPSNFSKETYGTVTLRRALRQSLNIATVKVSEQVGYGAVANLARTAGLGRRVRATPSLALGTYEVTPMDLAGAYTVFANGGVKVSPYMIEMVEDADGTVLMRNQPKTSEIVDPRVAYLMTSMLEDVIDHGTAYDARARGFWAPAAGKTGTDDDGWFVGYTSNLLCVVWIGFDDNTDLELEGAKSALPVWTEFMKRATQLPAYKKTAPFPEVEGISSVEIDPDTGNLAGPNCPENAMEFFIQGTEPTVVCDMDHNKSFLEYIAQAGQSIEGSQSR